MVQKLANARVALAEKKESASGEKTSVVNSLIEDHYTEVHQIIRTIGHPDNDPSAMDVDAVNAHLSAMMKDGWVIHTARSLGVIPGGAILYYLLVR